MNDFKELREWIQLLFIIVGGFIGLFVFIQNMKQRRLENALKIIDLFRKSLQEGDMGHWEQLLRSSSEPAGAKPGHYIYASSQIPIENLFSEGSSDGGAVARMAESLEIICHELITGTIDARYVWFELGQLLQTMHYWLVCSQGSDKQPLIMLYPSIDRTFKKFGKNFNKWPSRVYAYVE